MTENKILSLEEVAKLLGVSERTIRREVNAGKLRAFKVGSQMRFKSEAVEEYMRNQEISPSLERHADDSELDDAA